jgi:hypothetical protein
MEEKKKQMRHERDDLFVAVYLNCAGKVNLELIQGINLW